MFGILVFGDSITFGCGENPHQGWVGRLKNNFETKGEHNNLFNLGIPGNTSRGLLYRFETEIISRVKYIRSQDKFIIIIAIGINDSKAKNSPNAIVIKPKLYKDNIKKVVKIANKYTSKIVLIGLTPVDEKLTNPYENTYFTNKCIQKYNNILIELANKEKILYIDIFNELIKANHVKLLVDGLHPNKKGYDKMYNIIKNSLIKNKLIN